MARRSEIVTVYAAGLLQGLALVTFPATSAVFTNANDYAMSNTEYGGMFVPQAVTAIGSSLLGAGMGRTKGTRRIFLLGLFANLLAMALLVLSRFVMHEHVLAYGILLIATACMGVGFGFTVPALNTLAAALFPRDGDRALLVLNALLGLGTALAPVFVAIFVGLGFWWGLPALVGVLILGHLLFSCTQTLSEGGTPQASQTKTVRSRLPKRFWIFAAFALLYGVCETMNGNWASLYMTKHSGASIALASLTLAVFWIMVTVGRILIAAMERWIPGKQAYRILPFVVSGALIASAVVPKESPLLGMLTFAMAGLGCSALLPLTLSFGQKELRSISTSVAGFLIASYQVGYGIAAFGVGPLQSWVGLDMSIIFGATTGIALTLSALAFLITRTPRPPV